MPPSQLRLLTIVRLVAEVALAVGHAWAADADAHFEIDHVSDFRL
jgi:hypothetical protein